MAFGRRTRFGLGAGCLAIVAVLCLAGCSGDRTQRHARQAPAVGRKEVPAAGATGPIALSSLRGRIAFSHGDDVWVADASGEHSRRLTRRPGPEFDPSWSPDGNKIAYRDSRRGINNNDEIYVMDSDGRRRRNLTRGPVDEWSPSWSPDGRLIAFFSGDLYVMRPDGGHARAINKVEGEYPAWSRAMAAAWLSCQRSQAHAAGDPNYDVFVVGRNGNGLRRLTDWPGEDGWPTWSPDGQWIAFSSTHGTSSGHLLLYLMRSDGSDKHVLVPKVEGDFPVWSPDGNAIMFSGGHHDHLWVVRPNGTGLRELPLTGWLPDWHQPDTAASALQAHAPLSPEGKLVPGSGCSTETHCLNSHGCRSSSAPGPTGRGLSHLPPRTPTEIRRLPSPDARGGSSETPVARLSRLPSFRCRWRDGHLRLSPGAAHDRFGDSLGYARLARPTGSPTAVTVPRRPARRWPDARSWRKAGARVDAT